MSAVRQVSALGMIRRISARDAVGLKGGTEMHVRDTGGLKLVYSALSVTLSGDGHRIYGNSSGTITLTAPVVTATPVGGAGPFTYSWARTDGGSGTWTITQPSGPATSFQIDLSSGENSDAVFACTVTDTSGASVVSDGWNVFAINLGGGL